VQTLTTFADRVAASSVSHFERLWSSLATPLGLLVLGLFTLAVAAAGLLFPETNWDVLAYLASAHETPGISAEALHRHAYDAVRNAVTEGEFTVLTEDRPYRVRQYADPEAFVTMLGFYKVKWLYVSLIGWLSEVTAPLYAVHLISASSAAVIGGLTISWLWSAQALRFAPLVVAALMMSQFGLAARLGTPDAFSAALLLAGAWAFLRKFEVLTAVFLFLAFLARPDHAAYLGVLLVVSMLMRSFSPGVLAAFIAALAAYMPITQAAGHPGWWMQMWFTHVEYVGTLEGFAPAFSPVVYAKIIVQAAVRSLVSETWMAVLVAGSALWWLMARFGAVFGPRERILLAGTLVAVAAKFVVFPLHETRFYLAYLIPFSLVLIAALPRLAPIAKTR
jgi:hypothetical protein